MENICKGLSDLKENATPRSSRLKVFCKKGVLKNFAKFAWENVWQSLFFNKVADLRHAILLKKETMTEVFSCEFYEIFRTLFYRTPLVAASARPNIILFEILLRVWEIFTAQKMKNSGIFLAIANKWVKKW